MYNYYYRTADMPPREVLDNTAGFFWVAMFLAIFAAMFVIYIIALAKIFKKAGKPGWAAIVPFYNAYVLAEVAWGNGLYFLASFIPIVNSIYPIFLTIKLGTSFRKSGGFIVGLVLLPFIFVPMLGFGDGQYFGPDDQFDILPKKNNNNYQHNNQYNQYYQYNGYNQPGGYAAQPQYQQQPYQPQYQQPYYPQQPQYGKPPYQPQTPPENPQASPGPVDVGPYNPDSK